MRRIIERIVTVVTTTTWKISWETDTNQADPEAAPASHDLPLPEILSDTAQSSQLSLTAMEVKEVDPPQTEKVSHQSAAKLPDDPNYLSVEERK